MPEFRHSTDARGGVMLDRHSSCHDIAFFKWSVIMTYSCGFDMDREKKGADHQVTEMCGEVEKKTENRRLLP